METRRWVNQSQPQTLYIGTILLYLEAVTGLIFGNILLSYYGALIAVVGLVAMVAAGYGIANERRWGFYLGVGLSGAAVLAALLIVFFYGIDTLLIFGFAAQVLFAVALFVLLIHPQSRDYQRIWFK